MNPITREQNSLFSHLKKNLPSFRLPPLSLSPLIPSPFSPSPFSTSYEAPNTPFEVLLASSDALSIAFGDLSWINSFVISSSSVDGLVTASNCSKPQFQPLLASISYSWADPTHADTWMQISTTSQPHTIVPNLLDPVVASWHPLPASCLHARVTNSHHVPSSTPSANYAAILYYLYHFYVVCLGFLVLVLFL